MEDRKFERHSRKPIYDDNLWNDSFKKVIDNFLFSLKKLRKSIYDVILNNEKDFWVVVFLCLLTLFLMIYLIC